MAVQSDAESPPAKRSSPALPGGIVSLRASLGYSFTGQFFYLVSQLGILSALSHFHGPTAVGEFGLALALTTPLFLLLNMGFRTAQAVDVGATFSFAEYGGLRLLLTAAALIASLALGALFSERLSTLVIVTVVTLAKVFESVSNLSYGAFQQAGRMELVAGSLALRGSVTLAVFLALLAFGANPATALLSQVVVWGVTGMFFDYPRASRLAAGKFVWPCCSARRSWRLLRYSSPLGAGLLANSLQMSIPRLMVEWYLGLEALGLFTAVGYFQQASVTASNALSNAIVNHLARLNRDNRQGEFRGILVRLLLLFTLAGLAGIAVCFYLGEFLLVILFGKLYETAAPLLLIVSIVITLRMISTLPQSVLFAQHRFKLFFVFQLMSLGLTITLGYYIIPERGLVGAGYVLLFAAMFRLLLLELFTLFVRPGKPQNGADLSLTEAGPL
jgi:O-antigen/teichoic acid export membrane protein